VRGRKPDPPVLRMLKGNPSGRAIPADVRKAVRDAIASGVPLESTVGPPPRYLSERAAAVWAETASSAPWLEPADRALLESFCLAVLLMRDDPNRLRTAAQIVKSAGAELGLSPTSRTRLRTKPEAPVAAGDFPKDLSGYVGSGG
jgi:phage terminase small subunit